MEKLKRIYSPIFVDFINQKIPHLIENIDSPFQGKKKEQSERL